MDGNSNPLEDQMEIPKEVQKSVEQASKEKKVVEAKKRLLIFAGKIKSQGCQVTDMIESLCDNPSNENLDELMIEVASLQSIVYLAQKNARIYGES
jgi:hypothetical protein